MREWAEVPRPEYYEWRDRPAPVTVAPCTSAIVDVTSLWETKMRALDGHGSQPVAEHFAPSGRHRWHRGGLPDGPPQGDLRARAA